MLNKTICIVEGGLFGSWAHVLAKDYERVLHFRPWTESFAHPNDLYIGTGYDRIESIDNFWDHVNEVDTFCFLDVHFADWANHLRSLGKHVWSAFDGEELELYRAETKELLTKIGLPVSPYKVVFGMDDLRKFLEKNEDRYIKISRLRGITETFHSINYDLVKPKLDELEHELGGAAVEQEFIVEESVKAVTEVGYDGYTIQGKFPKTAIYGCEVKDCGYLGQVKPYNLIPKEVRTTNEKLSPVLEKYGYQGFFSTEIRVTKDNFYPVDFTCRAASPAGEAMQELYGNWGEIIEGGANGELVEPKPTARYGAQAILTSEFARENWLPISIPKELRDCVKLYHCCMIEGQEYVVPTGVDMPEIGSVVATGATANEAIKRVKEYADQIEAFELKCNTDSLSEAKSELDKAA